MRLTCRYLDRASSHGPGAAAEVERLFRQVEDSSGGTLQVPRVQVEIGSGIERGQEDGSGLGLQCQRLDDPVPVLRRWSGSRPRPAAARSRGRSDTPRGAGGSSGGDGTGTFRSCCLVSIFSAAASRSPPPVEGSARGGVSSAVAVREDRLGPGPQAGLLGRLKAGLARLVACAVEPPARSDSWRSRSTRMWRTCRMISGPRS